MKPEWIMVALNVAGLIGAGMLVVDIWVHKQGTDDTNLRRDIRQLTRESKGIRSMIRKANERASEHNSRVITRIAAIETDVTRLKALDESQHRHIRREDLEH